MGNLNPNIPSPELARLMTAAAGNMKSYGIKLLTPQLLLRTFLDDKTCAAHQILKKLSEQKGFDWHDFERRVETMARNAFGRNAKFNFTDDFGKDIPLADELLVTVDEGLTIAQARDKLNVTSGHALAAMADQRVTTFAVLNRIGVTQGAVMTHLAAVTQHGTSVIRDYVEEAKAGSIQPIFERKELLQEMFSLLALSSNRHIILVGEEGSGKRTLAQSLALSIVETGSEIRSLVQINETALLENPLAAMRAGLRRASGGILIVPNIGRFFPSRGSTQQFPNQVNRELHKAILGNEQTIVGTSVQADYDRLAGEAIIRENSNRVDVAQTSSDETISILNYHRTRLEQEYELSVQREALEMAEKLAKQYMKTIARPSSALQLVERACALVKMAGEGQIELGLSDDKTLSAEDVTIAASRLLKIPVSKLNADESSKYANMVDHLHKRIIGQDEAVMAVSRAVKIARVGLRKPKRPIGSFLFLGPSGVGKSELAKALAEFLFGKDDAMVVLDMSEYQEESSVNRLIGAPPGYVGFEGGGQLTDHVRENPYTVVLLDEIEKAHPRVLDVLLQVFEEGRLTDGQGRLTTFSETVVIMTSNLGAKHMLVPVIGDLERELVMESVHGFLRPEFINRIDDIILFHQLTPPQLAKILDLMLRGELKLAASQGLHLDVTAKAKKWMLAQNKNPEFGARPLRRIIQRNLIEPLADFLLESAGGEAKEKQIKVGAAKDKLTFKIETAEKKSTEK